MAWLRARRPCGDALAQAADRKLSKTGTTYAAGKWHFMPAHEGAAAGPCDRCKYF